MDSIQGSLSRWGAANGWMTHLFVCGFPGVSSAAFPLLDGSRRSGVWVHISHQNRRLIAAMDCYQGTAPEIASGMQWAKDLAALACRRSAFRSEYAADTRPAYLRAGWRVAGAVHVYGLRAAFRHEDRITATSDRHRNGFGGLTGLGGYLDISCMRGWPRSATRCSALLFGASDHR